MIAAVVLGSGSGTLLGKMDSSKATLEGRSLSLVARQNGQEIHAEKTHFWKNDFLRTTALRGVPNSLGRGPFLVRGVENGGACLFRAAVQSKGTEDEIEAVEEGEWYIAMDGRGRLLRGVTGARCAGDVCALACAFVFASARRRRKSIVVEGKEAREEWQWQAANLRSRCPAIAVRGFVYPTERQSMYR